MNIVIMAGGGGSRLWPVSRKNAPKQFLDLGTGKTLIEHAYERARALTEPENIYVATSESYRRQIQDFLPDVTADRVFYEPERRDTTAAFVTIALRLRELGQGSQPTIFMWSDHIFTREDVFLKDLKKIPEIILRHPESIVIIGHKPISSETGLGYMEVREQLTGFDNVFKLRAFKEKPDLETAKQYVGSDKYYWNLGYFSLHPDYLLREIQGLNPDLQDPIAAFAAALKSGDNQAVASAYSQFPKVAIEYTLIEKTSPVFAVTGDYGWSDVGNWGTIKAVFGTAGDHMPRGHHVHVDSKDNYVYNTTDKIVSLIGMRGVIVVVTDDAILVTDKSNSNQVKEVVNHLEEQGESRVL